MKKKVILAGDYNICPTKNDVANEEMISNDAVYQKESKDLFRTISNVGFFDGFRSFTIIIMVLLIGIMDMHTKTT